jgi:hypothetical protein
MSVASNELQARFDGISLDERDTAPHIESVPPAQIAPPDRPAAGEQGPVTVADFRAYMPSHQYIFIPSRELWPAASVNARCENPTDAAGKVFTKSMRREAKDGSVEFKDVPMSPSQYLDEYQAVDQMTWAPGEKTVIENRLVDNGGWIDRDGCACFNLYRPPTAKLGIADMAASWVDHIRLIYPDDADHIIKWLAHRVQRPGEKINHGIVLGGGQGIGKDTVLEPVKYAVGPWNVSEVSPTHLLGNFNGFVKSVILRISEAHDLGDIDRFAFYEHMKIYTAAPPDVLRCNEKHLREHSVMNVCGVIVTTNHKTDGIYLPADDRRHYVAWSDKTREDFAEGYWRKLYAWYQSGGLGHVAAYLNQLDLSDFDPKAPPRKTPAFWDIVVSNRSPEDAELADGLELIGNPKALTLADLQQNPLVDGNFRVWLEDPRNRRQIPHRLESAGYVAVASEAQDRLWVINKKRQTIYARKEFSIRDRGIAAAGLHKDRTDR